MGWEPGRQGGGYFKLKLLECSWPVKFDMYLIKFPRWSDIKTHLDDCPEGYEHHRINVLLRRARVGGRFYILDTDAANAKEYMPQRFMKFRPDLIPHGMTQVTFGSSLWFTVGWLRKQRRG